MLESPTSIAYYLLAIAYYQTGDIARAQSYYTTERANLAAMQIAIDTGEYIGASL